MGAVCGLCLDTHSLLAAQCRRLSQLRQAPCARSCCLCLGCQPELRMESAERQDTLGLAIHLYGVYGADTGVPPAPHAERPCRTQCERFIPDKFALRSQRNGGPSYSAYVITQPRCLLASSAHSIIGRLQCFPGSAHSAPEVILQRRRPLVIFLLAVCMRMQTGAASHHARLNPCAFSGEPCSSS